MDTPWHEFVDAVPETAAVEVRIGPVGDLTGYSVYGGDVRVHSVLEERTRHGEDLYQVRFRSGERDEVSLADLLHLPNGPQALEDYEAASLSSAGRTQSSRSSVMPVSLRPSEPRRKRSAGFVDITTINLSDEDSVSTDTRKRVSLVLRKPQKRTRYNEQSTPSSDDDLLKPPRRSLRQQQQQTAGDSRTGSPSASSSDSNGDTSFIDSFMRKASKNSTRHGPTRHSERAGRSRRNMRERYEDDIPKLNNPNGKAAPKVTAMKEYFPELSGSNGFRNRHITSCMTCGDHHEGKEEGHLVYCQGCTGAYHTMCLGSRNGRDHLVTKVGKADFVLQCRRCVEYAIKKDPIAPRHSQCQVCREPGAGTKAFRSRKSPRDEQKEREDNNGEDPIIAVDPNLINNKANVLFRCVRCDRAWHMHHLPAREENMFETQDQEQKSEERWNEYAEDWACLDCLNATGKVGGLVAWRPRNMEHFSIGMNPTEVLEDEKEYLVKWEGKPYIASLWMPGAWIWKVASKNMLVSFFKRNDGKMPPIVRTEDAIPEEYLRVDIVFKVEYNNIVADQIEEVDLARVREVARVLVKYKGLSYEDVVWDTPPDPVQDPERWQNFKSAYEDWVRGRYIRLPPSSTLSHNVRKVKGMRFEEKVMLKEQPKSVKGGELMSYQLEGLNWIYYQWHHNQNAILADEMGLGKTIQVISFLSVLQEKHYCWPFLVVVPNATVANWKREIKHWVPSLRVVTYFGSARAIELTERYELFRENKKDLACHVVVTSYEAAQSQACQRVLRKVPWQGQVVDEGQRLKNDKNILYSALSQMRAPFKLLMTGTPLQNNQRELFNLLQFLDPAINASMLAEKYETLTKENIVELHEMLRPFFLRRTKAQVLSFLPTMAQIIVPVTMTGLQKHLYKNILAQNTDILASVFGGDKRTPAKAGLRNILMQLRKCLCHPFVYNLAIEERALEAAVSHRQLVEASAKLQLLEIMLPKLQERGHRVLIFSQFLNMLTIMEDFLQDLGLEHSRLDGSMSSLQKQKCIDGFNAPDSKTFAFLLSTRAGGVGINLATADTVIILDPDFNPHQDIQAISRAHRIGQKKKVLVFQITTRMSAEEKIMQIGKKKMALDHALIDSMDGDEETADDLEAVLRYGAEALFKGDTSADIRYDSDSVDKLLDRSQIENTKADQENSAESQFSFARVWQNESSSMEAGLGVAEDEAGPNSSVWDQILAERTRQAEDEAKQRAEKLGRGKRQRKDIDYQTEAEGAAAPGGERDDYDTDFQARESEEESPDEEAHEAVDEKLLPDQPAKSRSKLLSPPQPPFKRAEVSYEPAEPAPNARACPACTRMHAVGSCPLKVAGPEYCGLCGLAHFTYQRTCPHLHSETQVRAMLAALSHSPESKELVDKARRLLQGIKGSIVQQKKRRDEAKLRAPGGPPRPVASGPLPIQLQQAVQRAPVTTHPYNTYRPPPPGHGAWLAPPGMSASPYPPGGYLPRVPPGWPAAYNTPYGPPGQPGQHPTQHQARDPGQPPPWTVGDPRRWGQ